MRLLCYRNGASSEVLSGLLPWQNTTEIPKFASKEEYRTWHSVDKNSDAQHFNAMEGINSSMKIGFENAPFRALGLVADYDAKNLSDSEIAAGLKRLNQAHPPTAWNKTYSGGVRIVWVFEKPVFYHSPKMWEWFIKKTVKELKLKAAFPGLDDALFEKPGQTYVSGTHWSVTANTLSKEFTAVAEYDACVKATDVGGRGDIEVPIEIVEKAMHEKFPNRWTGAFNIGARGVRFFSPEADNPSGALIRSNGVTCFTGPVPFMSWEQIFGRQFVQAYRESREGAILSSMYSDPDQNVFYIRIDGKSWVRFNTDDTKRYLKSVHRLSDNVPKGASCSEIDDLLIQLKLRRQVKGALPFPHRPEEVIEWAGHRFINTGDVKLVQPVGEPQLEGENFPWIWNAFNTLFPDSGNREHLLAWLKTWYVSCLRGKPCRGHAIFIVGPPGTGKTLITRQVIGRMMGGYADASGFIVEGEGFNSEAFSKAVWCIDDSLAVADRKVHARFSSVIKASVTNDSMKFDKKYGYKGSASFTGRTLVTANDDIESLTILPDTGSTLLHAVNFYRSGSVKIPVAKDEYERYAVIDRELPYFCRWLVDYQPASWIVEDPRFGIESFHDKSLLQDAKANSTTHNIMEVIDAWRTNQIAQHKLATTGENIKKPYVQWSAEYMISDFTRVINTDQSIRGMLPRQLYANTLGKVIAKSIETGEYNWVTSRKEMKGSKLVFHEVI